MDLFTKFPITLWAHGAHDQTGACGSALLYAPSTHVDEVGNGRATTGTGTISASNACASSLVAHGDKTARVQLLNGQGNSNQRWVVNALDGAIETVNVAATGKRHNAMVGKLNEQ